MKIYHILAIVALLGSGGCRVGVLAKRQQELCCPTDIRRQQSWIWGNDAIFRYPCCTDEVYAGYKPTCWREWDAPAAVWRDQHCGESCLAPPSITAVETILDAPERLAPPPVNKPTSGQNEEAPAATDGDAIPSPDEMSQEADEASEAPSNDDEATDDLSSADAEGDAEEPPPESPDVPNQLIRD